MQLYSSSDGRLSLRQLPSFRPRPHEAWWLRERDRKRPPLPTDWSRLDLDPLHFLRPSQHVGKLEYFRTRKDLEFDKLRVVNPADYLREFHPHADVELLAGSLLPRSFKISATPEEAVEAYTKCSGDNEIATSCMRQGGCYGPSSATAFAGDIWTCIGLVPSS